MNIPEESFAVGFTQGFQIDGQQAGFQDLTVALPKIQPHDLLVKVAAVSVNPVDTKRRQVLPKTQHPNILGYDAAGEVMATGEAVYDFTAGDQVYYAGTTRRFGSDMAYQVIDSRLVAKRPEKLTFAQSAAIPLTALTAWELLFEKMQFLPKADANLNQRLLIINGAGGVGSMLSQLAKWSGLRVYATASPRNFDWLMQNKVDVTLDYHQDIVEQLKMVDIIDMDGIAILYDPKPYFNAAAQLIKPFGHIGSIVEQSNLPIGLIKNKSASFDWEYMFAKSDFGYHMATQGEILAKVAQLIDSGIVKTTMTQEIKGINATTLTQAHKIIEGGRTRGKLVLTAPFGEA